ncbi:hypothetical protein, partial [uncultured Thiodictyon sp.]|uniref:hypothetical protein n=1 Tax=uncultured Thiodictyon sp. TaxID=1846217 RepID=UPI0025E404C5
PAAPGARSRVAGTADQSEGGKQGPHRRSQASPWQLLQLVAGRAVGRPPFALGAVIPSSSGQPVLFPRLGARGPLKLLSMRQIGQKLTAVVQGDRHPANQNDDSSAVPPSPNLWSKEVAK